MGKLIAALGLVPTAALAGGSPSPVVGAVGGVAGPSLDDPDDLQRAGDNDDKNDKSRKKEKKRKQKQDVTVVEGLASTRNFMPLGPPVSGAPVDTLYALMSEDGKKPIGAETSKVGATLNLTGGKLMDQFARLHKISFEAFNTFGAVRKNAGKGMADLQRVMKASGAVATGAAKSPALRLAIEAYTGAITNAKVGMRDVWSATLKLEAATEDLNTANLKHKEGVQARKVKKLEVDLAAEQKAVDALRGRIGLYTGLAISAIRPDHWGTMVTAAVACIGEHALEGIVDTSRVEKLQKELEGATAELHAIQADVEFSAIIAAGMKMEAAGIDLDKAQTAFGGLAQKVQEAETTVIEAMKKTPGAKEATAALDMRATLIRDATKADKGLKDYLTASELVAKHTRTLKSTYESFRQFVAKGQLSPSYAAALQEVVDMNVAVLAGLITFLEDYRALARVDLQWLAQKGDGAYMKGYDAIPEVLSAIMVERTRIMKTK